MSGTIGRPLDTTTWITEPRSSLVPGAGRALATVPATTRSSLASDTFGTRPAERTCVSAAVLAQPDDRSAHRRTAHCPATTR